MTERKDYFDTPARRERLQLLVHLIANAEATPYLRAPAGAGKTRFLTELRTRLLDDYRVVPLDAGGAYPLRDQLAEALGMDTVDTAWPEVVIDPQDDRVLLVMVDDAQALGLSDVADLLDLAGIGARLLLAGSGELVPVASDWEIHYVDLPPLSEEEAKAFLQHRTGSPVDDSVVRVLYRASGGQPGLLLDGLDGLGGLVGSARTRSGERGPMWRWILMAIVLLIPLGLAWFYQDRINAWFEPGAERPPAPEDASIATPAVAVPPGAAPVAEPPQEHKKVANEPPIFVSDTPPAKPSAGTGDPIHGDAPADDAAASKAPASPDDPVLDAIIDEAIRAAGQPTADPETSPRPGGQQRSGTEGAAETDRSAVSQKALPAEPASVAPSGPSTGERADAPAIARDLAADAPASASQTGSTVQPLPATPGRIADEPSPSADAKPSPQPKRAAAVPAAPPVRPRRPPAVKAASKRPPVPAPAPRKGTAWLLAQSPGRWTLQLVGSRERASIDVFLRRHRIAPPYAVFERDLAGQPWYSLVAGSYASRDAAVAARVRLPAGIARGGVWPRTFASIREQMKNP